MSLDMAQNFCSGTVTATTSTTVTYSNTGAVPFPTTLTAPYDITIWNSTLYSVPQLDPNVSIFRVTSATSTVFTGSWVSPSDEYASGTTLSLISGDVYSCTLFITAKMIDDLNTLLFGNLTSSNLSATAGITGSQLSSPLDLSQNVTLGGTTTNSGTISGGTVSGATLSGTTTNSGTISGGAVNPDTMTSSGLITANGGLSITTSGPFTGLPYDIAGGISGPIAGSQYVLYFDAVREVNIPADFAGSLASVLTAFTDAATYTIYHNGTSVGTISFAASGTSGTFSTSSAFTLAIGDSLTIQAPSTADATAANLAITILANLA